MNKAINIKTASAAYAAYLDAQKELDCLVRFMWPNEKKTDAATTARDDAREAYEIEAARLLGAELDAVQARAKVRTVTPCEIVEALHDLQKHLDIPKKALEGVKVHFDLNAQAFPSAYKYTPESTHVSAEFKGGSWRVYDISREECRRPSFKFTVTHTDASRAALLQRFTAIEAV